MNFVSCSQTTAKRNITHCSDHEAIPLPPPHVHPPPPKHSRPQTTIHLPCQIPFSQSCCNKVPTDTSRWWWSLQKHGFNYLWAHWASDERSVEGAGCPPTRCTTTQKTITYFNINVLSRWCPCACPKPQLVHKKNRFFVFPHEYFFPCNIRGDGSAKKDSPVFFWLNSLCRGESFWTKELETGNKYDETAQHKTQRNNGLKIHALSEYSLCVY